MQFVVMTEEPSMEECLKELLPKLLPDDWAKSIIIPHEGKSDLEKSIPRKLKVFRSDSYWQYRFVVIRDQDSGNCHTVKENLVSLCEEAGVTDALIRIACHELEAWFLGDLQAVECGLGIKNLACHQDKRKYRNPDHLGSPSAELDRLVKGYRKIEGARKIAPYLDLKLNKSRSFNAFISGINKVIRSIQG